MSNDDNVADFLSHHGIKGMRWGVRRSDKELGSGSSQKVSVDVDGKVSTAKAMNKAKAGSVVTVTHQDGTIKTLVKKKNGAWEETFVSADAERHLRTRNKEAHELSDREINEALNRAKKIKEYNELFSDDPHAALRRKVDALELEKKYRTLSKELAPPTRLQKLGNLVTAGSKGWEDYKKAEKVFQEFDEKRKDGIAKRAAKNAAKNAATAAVKVTANAATQQAFKVNPNSVKFRPNPSYGVGKGLMRP